ncbi:unnamed protein product [Rotaria sordida]|uniref:ubiquitinyl hydrolase 1 n=1 Tax=Rotaria sordida TaxID=392033 RepID=A0A818WLC0_9BILA|nr:unnamed protein product [Rotaria sordida]
MPLARESALTVIFELQMPIEIRCYRDIIWQFINRPNPQPKNCMHEWLNVPSHGSKLESFYTGLSNHKVKLVSSTKSISQTHYSTPPSIAFTPTEGFLFENSLKIQISPTKPIGFEDEVCILTPQLDHPDYKQLQFTINTTQFVQNDVIAQLCSYSSRLKPSQIVEFGSFRSGHRLQWWNLLTILEMDSLSFAEESVAILIIHSILQYGPLISDSNILSDSWCPESHQQLLEDHFVDELISRLNRHLDDCALNWQNELVLVVITMITMRVLSICNTTRENKAANLAIKCRKIAEKWINFITRSIQTISPSALDEVENLRLKMVTVGISCILTFSTNQQRINFLLSSNEDIVSLLKAATTVHDNIILTKNRANMSIFIRNIMRFSERVLVMIQPTVAKFLQKTFYQGLNEFTVIYWAVTKRKGSMNGQWTKRTENPYDGWYDCQYDSRVISIDFIRGTFLIDNMTIGFLPDKIIFHESFVRVFGDHTFEVQAADSPNTYITKHSYHGTGLVHYDFHFNDRNNHLIIKERYMQTNDIFQLIPHSFFENELPDMFVSNHSHWWNTKNQTIEFRPVHFKDINFLTNKSYILSMKTGYVTTTESVNTQILINQSSTFFQSLFNRYFIRLDDKPYVYMMRDNVFHTNAIIHIHLSRLGIAFQYDPRTNIIMSREYSDMCVDEHQLFGTLTSLTSGLLLSPLAVNNNHKMESYPYRKLIVPFGELRSEKTSDINQQAVIIQRSSSVSFLHQYFVFILNDRLKILQSTDSPTGWLYLALLHAMTSHPLPDQYTGMTGMERAFQLLNSAGCWSDQPFDSLSLNILSQIAAISPKVDYYPEHLTSMEKIDWNNNAKFPLNNDQLTLLGGILVCWTLEQQLERALHYAIHDKLEDFAKEISNTPHSNWKPSEHISWLILELEMNITIREIQINVARHMMQTGMATNKTKVKNLVLQMNMGEGKTSVILPMLAASLASSDSSLVRIVVLKSLFPTNYQSLRCKLGGLLNRRIFSFLCRRDMNFNEKQINHIFNRLKQGLHNCDVILTSPEDILSFDLLTIDKCRRNEFDVGRSVLTVQRWLKLFARDVLDESDEILHVKYQLVYTVGSQQNVDGGAERWNIIQTVLYLVKKHALSISKCVSEEVCYKSPPRKSAFPEFRLQSHQPFLLLCEIVANDWLNQKSYRHEDKKIILSFILATNSSIEQLDNKFSQHDIQQFLIIRGLLSSEVLLVALKKRYRVNYGITSNPSFHRLMAVPFRAKDVAADRTEFGHPDVALVLTQLSYYYSGLSDSQLIQCFDRLSEKETDPTSIYEQWILAEEQDRVPTSIKQWKGVNLKDYQQRTHDLFPTLRYNMIVVNYFLNHFVFPREAKQFPHKLVASAWDLSSSLRSKIVTGFSGTNDTQLLLPVHIQQYDLPELQKTDAIVVNNLLQRGNESYQYLPFNTTSEDILNQIINYKKTISVILDVGALFIDGTNRDIAVKWLNLSKKDKIDYAVYFDSDSIVVCDRQLHHYRFETSPASERLDRCVFYLDEIHTRGTDFKFPNGFQAAVTLGNGLTKDRFAQACMRMRNLGKGHSLTFWSSNEVHQQIITLKKRSHIKNQKETIHTSVNLIDILRWVYENTKQSTWDGLHHWATQSLSFQRKVSAFQAIQWENQQQSITCTMMKKLVSECLEPEIIELKRIYGPAKVLETIEKVYFGRSQQCNHHLSTDIHNVVLKRLHEYGGTKQRLSQLLDEEQQRELEHELEEERQLAQPLPVKPCCPRLCEEIKQLCDINSKVMNLAELSNVFHTLPHAFTDTKFFKQCQPNSWPSNFWVSTEFQRVTETKGISLDPFMRPPRWIVVYRYQHIIFISAFEANWLMGCLKFNKSSATTLRLLLPRIKRFQSIFVNTPTLTIPSPMGLSNRTVPYFIPIEWLVQLFVFNGTLYFDTVDEQTAYCQCLSLCPQPRTSLEKAAFEKGWIAVDGFVSDSNYRRCLSINRAQFTLNPLTFVKQLIENRNNFQPPISSHVGSIILNSFKTYETIPNENRQ